MAKAGDAETLRARLKRLSKSKHVLDSPGDARNLVVLCREHHRLKYSGIHTVSFPVWPAVAAVPSGGGVLSREELLMAVERISKIDEELASYAANNYQPQRL